MPLEFDIENDILYQRGRAKGREEGRAEEMQIVAQERLEMKRKMKQFGLSVSLIAEATGLSVEEVTKI